MDWRGETRKARKGVKERGEVRKAREGAWPGGEKGGKRAKEYGKDIRSKEDVRNVGLKRKGS